MKEDIQNWKRRTRTALLCLSPILIHTAGSLLFVVLRWEAVGMALVYGSLPLGFILVFMYARRFILSCKNRGSTLNWGSLLATLFSVVSTFYVFFFILLGEAMKGLGK